MSLLIAKDWSGSSANASSLSKYSKFPSRFLRQNNTVVLCSGLYLIFFKKVIKGCFAYLIIPLFSLLFYCVSFTLLMWYLLFLISRVHKRVISYRLLSYPLVDFSSSGTWSNLCIDFRQHGKRSREVWADFLTCDPWLPGDRVNPFKLSPLFS